jgi:hypothetical protein
MFLQGPYEKKWIPREEMNKNPLKQLQTTSTHRDKEDSPGKILDDN